MRRSQKVRIHTSKMCVLYETFVSNLQCNSLITSHHEKLECHSLILWGSLCRASKAIVFCTSILEAKPLTFRKAFCNSGDGTGCAASAVATLLSSLHFLPLSPPVCSHLPLNSMFSPLLSNSSSQLFSFVFPSLQSLLFGQRTLFPTSSTCFTLSSSTTKKEKRQVNKKSKRFAQSAARSATLGQS